MSTTKKARTRDARVTKIKVLGETWRVPRGFGAAYARAAKDDLSLARAAKPGEVIGTIRDLLALIGYEATIAQVVGWDLRRRVEAVVYAANVALRASDNPIQRHPRPSWLPETPWQGGVDAAGPARMEIRRGTPIPTEASS